MVLIFHGVVGSGPSRDLVAKRMNSRYIFIYFTNFQPAFSSSISIFLFHRFGALPPQYHQLGESFPSYSTPRTSWPRRRLIYMFYITSADFQLPTSNFASTLISLVSRTDSNSNSNSDSISTVYTINLGVFLLILVQEQANQSLSFEPLVRRIFRSPTSSRFTFTFDFNSNL